MKTVYAALALGVITVSEASAQVPTGGRARPVDIPVAATSGCELEAAGVRMAFAQCAPVPAGDRPMEKEIEVVEYRSGDDPGTVSIRVNGQVLEGFVLRHVGVTDPDDDGDGLPAAAERQRRGRLSVGNVTLDRVAGRSANIAWPPADSDGDGFPMVVSLENPAGGATHISLAGCTPEPAGTRAAPARGEQPSSVTMSCTSVRVEADAGASPYARWIAGATGVRQAGDTRDPQVERPVLVLHARNARGTDSVRLRGVELAGWSIDFDGARATVRWTLEVRVNRWEPA
ncbi:MAG: hypothetical protein KFH98_13140 [Gemmatimonadetes bacterium]|nr:hypothetical protein [Gemmatimonadota bacterium]